MSLFTASTVLVGRQAIYNSQLDVFGYSLLNRNDGSDKSISEMLITAFTEIGLERLVWSRPAFVCLPREFVTGHLELPVDDDRIIVQIAESVQVDDEVMAGIRSLRRKGVRIAADSHWLFTCDSRVIQLVDFIEVKTSEFTPNQLESEVRYLREQTSRFQLLAKEIENHRDFERCFRLGFEFFQGDFLSKPRIIEGKGLASHQMAIITLLAKLQSPDASIDEISSLVKQDVGLSLKLFRYVNSAACGLRSHVNSISKMLTLIGLKKLKQIISLVVISGMDQKPTALTSNSLVRARMCELVASRSGRTDAETCFTVGLFSLLDALLDQPLEDILSRIPLASELSEALLHREGYLGRLLECVIAFERGEWPRVWLPDTDDAALQQAFLDALAWVHGEGGIQHQFRPNN